MEATVEKIGEITLLTPAGERLDAIVAKEFKNHVAAVLDPASKVVIDMSRLRFVDSTGLGAIISFLKQSKEAGGDLKLCGISPSIRKLIELVRVDKIVEIFETKEEAVRSFRVEVSG